MRLNATEIETDIRTDIETDIQTEISNSLKFVQFMDIPAIIKILMSLQNVITNRRGVRIMSSDTTTKQTKQQREEVHRAIWAIADDLRGAVDGWDFKNYVLGTMFYRYISENLCSYINEGEWEAGNKDFDYARMSDADAEEAREGLVEEKGFFIPPSELFCNVQADAKDNENLNETLDQVFRHIEESAKGSQSEADFAGLFDDFDVNSNKLGSTVAKRNEKLTKLLNGIADMKLGSVEDHDIDAFGDAYEYLMSMYASNAGKSGGEFFTPADVSELLTRLGTVGKKQINKVYDPACGSGSLLLKSVEVLGKDGVRDGFYGQEINITTYNLCRINMFLHGIDFDKFDIACDDTLTSPQHWDDEPFELIVSNPPYSIKWAGDSDPLLINDPRFSPAGVLAPKSKADMAFIMHSLAWLAPSGAAAIVCFPGIMYRGGAEKKIRKYLIDNNFIDCIIQLPSNLFFGTSIATCIMVLKKGKNDNRTLFIDATNECVKVTNNNKLTPENIEKIVDAFAKREEIEHFVHLAEYDEIRENDYNLSVSTYVEPEDTREKIDIVKLNAEIKDIVAREQVLRDEIDKIIEEIEGGNADE
jgi:type I restriction enzyme M protein